MTLHRAVYARHMGVALIALAFVAAAVPKLPGCGRTTTSNAPSKPDQIYTLRGQITMLPEAGKAASEFQIRHEPIPSFVNKEGKVVGMNSMVMPFTPAPSLPLREFSVGDVVEFTFEVRWTARPASLVTAIKKLPADTKLDFGRATPPH